MKRLKHFILKLLRGNLKMMNPLMRVYLENKKHAWGVVYMLHRVEELDPNALKTNEELKVSPKFLDSIIKEYKRKGFDFLSLDKLYEVMSSGVKPQKPFVVFTLDDGYLDNYTNAYPIFKANNVPFCIYVTTNFPDKKAFLWWYALEDYLQERTEVTLGDGSFYPLRNLKEKDDAFKLIREKILQFPREGFEDAFRDLLRGFSKDIYSYVDRLSLDWEQVRILSQEPLCTLGAHTVHHFALTQLSDENVKYEIEEGTRVLKTKVERDILHFSYPHGLAFDREREIARSYGFRTITSCLSEVVRPQDNPLFIPRVILTDTAQ